MNYTSLAAELGIRGFISGREYRARCPLHQDTHPSFSMNIDSGAWICFSGPNCGAGEFFRLVQLVLNCSPGEARDWIASNGKHGSVELLSQQLNDLLNPENDPDYLPDNMGWRARYNALGNKTMPLWFMERGFTWETVNHWDIRFDLVMNAIIIPVVWEGELVGTVTRNYDVSYAKYVNSKNLPRENILFGDISKGQKQIIVCEGALDTLWFWQNGFNVGGLLGSSLTDSQVDILTAYRFGEIVLALDNDEAGIAGTKKAINTLIKAGWLLPQIKVVLFPGKAGEPGYRKDANDCDPQELKELFDNRKDALLI
jgi:hypothetical protein